MAQMRSISLAVALAGCASNSYTIPRSELARLATTPPEARGQHVRVIQELREADLGPPQPVSFDTQIVLFPRVGIYDDHRRGGYSTGNGGNVNVEHSSGGRSVGKMSGGGGDGKAEAIAILVVAATALVVAAAIEGSRFDGYAQLHPMHPVYLFGKDGITRVMPLAWIDPQTAAFTDHAIVRSTEGPWVAQERAALSREGFTYAMFGGVGTYTSADGSKGTGTATTVQFGYFGSQDIGVLGSMFFGWRDNAVQQTLFESRYTLELQGYPVVAGPFHMGLYGGGGAAYRWEDGFVDGNSGSLAAIGGAVLQLDINTRLAITGRLGATYAHGERMSDAMIGLSVY